MLRHMVNVMYFYNSAFRSMCAVLNMAVTVISLFSAFPVCFLSVLLVILRWFQLPLLLLVSHLFVHSTCAVFLLQGLYILEYSRILSLSFIIIIINLLLFLLLLLSSVLTTWIVELLNLTSGCPLHIILTYYNLLFHAVNFHITLTKCL